jgi:hypothetical protein
MTMPADQPSIPWTGLERGAWIAGVIGLAIWGLGWLLAVVLADPTLLMAVFFSYLFAFAFCLAIPLGAMAIWLIHNQTGGAWGITIHRVLEAATRTVPLMAVLFIPLLFGLHTLYLWTDPSGASAEHLHLENTAYLNIPWFLIRAACYFTLWSAVAAILVRAGAALERQADPRATRRFRLFSGLAFLVYALGMTFAAVDWLMSLEPDWSSTIYGMLIVAGQMVPALAFAVATTACLRSAIGSERLHPDVWNDLGNLMLASVMFWAYLSFSQWLLIWSGNLTEEIPWYVRRTHGGWQFIGALLATCYFGLPFVLLLSRRLKRDPRGLLAVGAFLVVLSVVHHYWLVAPVFAARAAGRYDQYGSLSVHWLDIAALAGVGGITFAVFVRQLRALPLSAPPPLVVEEEAPSHA